MPAINPAAHISGSWRTFTRQNWYFLMLSILIQLGLGLWFGHAYDIKIFMATGYLVGTGQNPYIAQDLTGVFGNSAFIGMTSVGYPPPWPLVLGLIYRSVYGLIPNLLVYNLAIKIPIIAANLYLAYLTADILKKQGAEAAMYRRAWLLLLLNPILFLFGAAWGQIDALVAVFALLSLVFLGAERWGASAVILALAISLKPTALPILPVAIIYLLGKSKRQVIPYGLILCSSMLLFCVLPWFVFKWDPTPILQHWNAHFTVGGGMAFMTFFELVKDSYALPGAWWLLGLLWMPALVIGALAMRNGVNGFMELLKKSTGMILIFFLTRTWLSEPNIILIMPLVLILSSGGELKGTAFWAVCVIPLVFSFFNTSLFQLLFPSLPVTMDSLLKLSDIYRSARLAARTLVVAAWLITGWWIVFACFKQARALVG